MRDVRCDVGNLDEESDDLVGDAGVDGIQMMHDTLCPLESSFRESLTTVLRHHRAKVVELTTFTHLTHLTTTNQRRLSNRNRNSNCDTT